MVNHIWPIVLAMESLIARTREKKLKMLCMLAETDGGDGGNARKLPWKT